MVSAASRCFRLENVAHFRHSLAGGLEAFLYDDTCPNKAQFVPFLLTGFLPLEFASAYRRMVIVFGARTVHFRLSIFFSSVKASQLAPSGTAGQRSLSDGYQDIGPQTSDDD